MQGAQISACQDIRVHGSPDRKKEQHSPRHLTTSTLVLLTPQLSFSLMAVISTNSCLFLVSWLSRRLIVIRPRSVIHVWTYIFNLISLEEDCNPYSVPSVTSNPISLFWGYKNKSKCHCSVHSFYIIFLPMNLLLVCQPASCSFTPGISSSHLLHSPVLFLRHVYVGSQS